MNSNNLKIVFEKENNYSFDIVYRMRFDSEILNLEFLPKEKIESNTIFIPGVHKDFGGINDQFAFGSSQSMDKYSNLFNNIENFDVHSYNPEEILLKYLLTQNLEIKRSNLNVNIHHA
jgi:hypothetical protein